MTGIAAIDGGTSYHTRTLREGLFAGHFSALVDVRALGQADLARHPCLLVPCRTNARHLSPHRDTLTRYVEGGGFLIVLGETRPDLFLEGTHFRSVRTNFWWWRDPGAHLGVRIAAPDHPLFRYLTEADLTWHVHGTLALEPPAEVLVRWDDPTSGGAIMVEAHRGSGRLLVTTLDPVYHHGSGFTPATTRFLEGFLAWLAETLAPPAGHG